MSTVKTHLATVRQPATPVPAAAPRVTVPTAPATDASRGAPADAGRVATFQNGDAAAARSSDPSSALSPGSVALLAKLFPVGPSKETKAAVVDAAQKAQGLERAILEAASGGQLKADARPALPAGLTELGQLTWKLGEAVSRGHVSELTSTFASLPGPTQDLVRQPLRALTLEAMRFGRLDFDDQVALHATLSLPEAAEARLKSFSNQVEWIASSPSHGPDFAAGEVAQLLATLERLPESERAAGAGAVRQAVFDEAGRPRKSFESLTEMEALRAAVALPSPAYVAPSPAEVEQAKVAARQALEVTDEAKAPSKREVVMTAAAYAPLHLAGSESHPVLGRLAAMASLPLTMPVALVAKGLTQLGRADAGSLVSLQELAPWLEKAQKADGLELAAHASVARALLASNGRDTNTDAIEELQTVSDRAALLNGTLQEQGRQLVLDLREE
ncbi:MAG: hypothetical protein K1X89_06735 [Myxococcaceae bacterium]|nr:hypothetical protein [Myxococcaceae bacterium]